MKVYQCDSCGKTLKEPYEIKMKEFYVGTDFENGMVFPVKCKHKVKIHLCDDCYRGLHCIAERKRSEG